MIVHMGEAMKQASPDRLMDMSDRLAAAGYRDGTHRPRRGKAEGEARIDLDALQHTIAVMKDEISVRSSAIGVKGRHTPLNCHFYATVQK